ncbi:hypothetical protein Ancab_023017 [Ancistrocladus abbreviatus]
MAETVVFFDFDKTILDCDSDEWVVESFGLTDVFNELLPTMPFNSLMDRMMKELHRQGRTTEDIAECLKKAPLHPNIISTIKLAYASGCDLRIVSDANVFFIETILKHHGIMECFSEINTNPGFVNEEGRLEILPFVDYKTYPHGCNLCPPNMCKGMIIERIQCSALGQVKRFIYVGDGKNDMCPSLKLSKRDCIMPRKNFQLWDLIVANPTVINANIHEWSDWEDLERTLINLINMIVIINDDQEIMLREFGPIDCKSQTSSISSTPESFRKVVGVKN